MTAEVIVPALAAVALTAKLRLPPVKPLRKDLVFYEGACGRCRQMVRWLESLDSAEVFRFAPYESDLYDLRMGFQLRGLLPDGLTVLTDETRVLTGGAAWRHVLGRLGGVPRLAAWGLFLIPRIVLDIVSENVSCTTASNHAVAGR